MTNEEKCQPMSTVKPPVVKALPPIENLTCCCCGNGARGRQWWNRDTGFGVCSDCVAWMKSRGNYDERNYGPEGVYHSIPETKE